MIQESHNFDFLTNLSEPIQIFLVFSIAAAYTLWICYMGSDYRNHKYCDPKYCKYCRRFKIKK